MTVPPKDDERPLCFISYARRDKRYLPALKALARTVAGRPIEIFVDESSLQAGDLLEATIVSAIQRSTLFVVGWSRHAAHSAWVSDEIIEALPAASGSRRRIVVARLDDTPVPAQLDEFNNVRLSTHGRGTRPLTHLMLLIGAGGLFQAVIDLSVVFWAGLIATGLVFRLVQYFRGQSGPATVRRHSSPGRRLLRARARDVSRR